MYLYVLLVLAAQNQEQQKDRDFHGVPAFGERYEEIDSAGVCMCVCV